VRFAAKRYVVKWGGGCKTQSSRFRAEKGPEYRIRTEVCKLKPFGSWGVKLTRDKRQMGLISGMKESEIEISMGGKIGDGGTWDGVSSSLVCTSVRQIAEALADEWIWQGFGSIQGEQTVGKDQARVRQAGSNQAKPLLRKGPLGRKARKPERNKAFQKSAQMSANDVGKQGPTGDMQLKSVASRRRVRVVKSVSGRGIKYEVS
jgi:hypothetical protein